MKKKDDPRHKMRVDTVKTLFANSFNKDSASNNQQIKDISSNLAKIDALISKNAPAWPISQLSPIDLATLRLAIWELLFAKKKEPYKVIVDEAVEIAKEYGSETSASFVNGVLGTIIKSKGKVQKSN